METKNLILVEIMDGAIHYTMSAGATIVTAQIISVSGQFNVSLTSDNTPQVSENFSTESEAHLFIIQHFEKLKN